jgi:hypothetical protein
MMIRNFSLSHLTAIPLVLFALGCESGGVGEPCTPEDEYQANFSGFAVTEVNVESRSFQCETRVCLVNHFQGRVSCPYGQTADEAAAGTGECRIPGSDDKINVAVEKQLLYRKTSETVYCSCRCDGPQSNARYCECPSGYGCVKLVDEIGVDAGGQLAGSYCVKDNTTFAPAYNRMQCNRTAMDCGEVDGS